MPGPFSRAQVEAIAALARLELDPSEVELFARQLGDILAYADQVQQIDTSGVPPTAYGVAHQSVDRPDEVKPSLDIGEALANAPEGETAPETAPDTDTPRGGFFKVPRVIG